MSIFDRVTDRASGNAEKYALRQTLFGTEDVLPMWVADMDIETPQCVRDAVIARAQHPVYGYEEMPQSAFDAQIGWMHRRHGVKLERDWMFYSHSVVASISTAIMAFTEPGEGVIVQPPVYPPFMKQVRRNHRTLQLNPLRRDADGVYRFDFEHLESIITPTTKLLLLCSPHNPVGRVWERDELETLLQICVRHGIIVFADEIHSDLVFAPYRHIPFASLGDAALTQCVSAMGPGKTFNLAGLAVSTVAIADETLRAQFEAVYEQIHFAQGTVFGHVAFEAAYREGEAWLEALTKHLGANAARLAALIARCEHVAFIPPEGTYLAWLDCKKMGYDTDKKLREFFICEARLGLSPGISFGKEGSGFMRLNFAVPTPTMDVALSRLAAALSLCAEGP